MTVSPVYLPESLLIVIQPTMYMYVYRTQYVNNPTQCNNCKQNSMSNTVKSLYFVGAQFSWFSWIPSTTNLHPQRIVMYNNQKLKPCL